MIIQMLLYGIAICLEFFPAPPQLSFRDEPDLNLFWSSFDLEIVALNEAFLGFSCRETTTLGSQIRIWNRGQHLPARRHI
jgi:hypothetical protein